MNKACLYDIGYCFCFTVEIDDNKFTLEDLKNEILEKRSSAILITDIVNLPFAIGSVTCLVYHTYSRRAYDLYYKFGGQNIRCIDPVTVQCILSGIGETSARRPDVIFLNRVY